MHEHAIRPIRPALNGYEVTQNIRRCQEAVVDAAAAIDGLLARIVGLEREVAALREHAGLPSSGSRGGRGFGRVACGQEEPPPTLLHAGPVLVPGAVRKMRVSPAPCVRCNKVWEEPSRQGRMSVRCPGCR